MDTTAQLPTLDYVLGLYEKYGVGWVEEVFNRYDSETDQVKCCTIGVILRGDEDSDRLVNALHYLPFDYRLGVYAGNDGIEESNDYVTDLLLYEKGFALGKAVREHFMNKSDN